MKLKKLTSVLLAAAVTVASLPAVTAEEYLAVSDVMRATAAVSGVNGGEESPAEDFEYRVNDDGESVTITKYFGSGGDVVIPSEIEGKRVTGIGDFAFSYCTSPPTTVTIPDGVTTIWVNAARGCFYGCTSLTAINVSEYNTEYSSIDGVLFNKEKTTLVKYPEGKNNANYIVPNTVTVIGIGAFYDCTLLTSIDIPDSVTTIATYDEFLGSTSLTSIKVAEANKKYSSRDGVLFNKDQTKLIKYPQGKKDISYIIPNGVTKINGHAFCNCKLLVSVEIPDGVTSISDETFSGCASLTSVIIPNSVTSIGGNWAFSNCSSLTNIDIPNSVTSIGYGTFSNCSSLKSVVIPNGVTHIEGITFMGCTSLMSVTIPDSVTRIDSGAFQSCTSLTSVTIPDSVTSIDGGSFDLCSSLTDINVDEDNMVYSSKNGVLFKGIFAEDEETELVHYPIGKREDTYAIPNGVTSIGEGSFGGCNSLTEVEIPDSVTNIGRSSFSRCSSLAFVEIPKSVTRIGVWAFASCTSLVSVDIPDSVTEIGDGLFVNCTSLISVVIPESVIGMTAIGLEEIGMFQGCNFDNVTIYGYADSFAEFYANRLRISFVSLSDSPKIQVDNGIVATVPNKSEATLENKTLEAVKIKSDEDSVTYNITLKNKDGDKIQPSGDVMIKIPVPANLDGEKCHVYRKAVNGTYIDLNAVYENGCMIFTTDHFSEFVVSVKKPVVLADMNGDGKITTVDAKWILQAVSGSRKLTPEQEAAADVNGDGKINAVDAKWILQAVSGSRVLG